MVVGAIWGLAYAQLGRPASGAIPGGFALIAAAVCVWLIRFHTLGRLREFVLGLMLILPALLQVSLGGYAARS